jgi:hypothetical protein
LNRPSSGPPPGERDLPATDPRTGVYSDRLSVLRLVEDHDHERKGRELELLAMRHVRRCLERRTAAGVESPSATRRAVEVSATTSAVSEWIKRVAADERGRDAVRTREDETTARKADLVRVHGRRLIDELRETVARDIEAFRSEFSGDGARELVFEGGQADGGFAVRKPSFPAATVSVAPNLDAAAVRCQYRFLPNQGLPPREDRFELVFSGADAETLHFKHVGTGQVFAGADALSEYLLVPVFTGRPR